MKNKLLLITSCLFVFNCSSEPEEEIPQVSSIYELGECRADREGEQALVTSDGENYKCVGGIWVHSSEEKDSSEKENVSEGFFTDSRDGRIYKTVKLGSRVWMAENLKYAFNDGVQSFCYLDKEEYCDYLGRLYTWSGAMAMEPKYDSTYKVKLTLPHRGVCPEGWHVSTMEDWEDLVDYVDAHNGNESVAWSLMSDEGWYFQDYDGLKPSFTVKSYDFKESNRNKFGFNLMSGIRFANGGYSGVGDSSLTWVASEDFQIEHIYAAARWPFLSYSYCYGYNDSPYKECVDASGNPGSYLEKRALYQKGMGKPVRCVSDKYDQVAKSTVVPKVTATGESEYNDATQTLLDKRDGTTYKTVKIGKQIWMAENLKYKTKGGNADDLEGSLCYDNKTENCDIQGRLYNWNAAMDIPQEYESARWLKIDYPKQGICPGGWHLPTDDEWQELMDYAIADVGEDNLMISLCKAGNDSYYDNDDEKKIADKYGFSVGCDRYGDDGVRGAEYDVLMQSIRDSKILYYWTATETLNPLVREFTRKGPAHSLRQFGRITYAPVRCLKD